MRLVRYVAGQKISLGALHGDCVIDLPQLCGAPVDMAALLGSPEVLENARKALRLLPGSEQDCVWPVADLTLLPPLPNPGKIIGVGLNYPVLTQDGKAARPQYPVLFERNAGSLIGPGAAVRLPREAKQVVIECELALVVGRGGKRIPESRALEALAGFTLANDVTARDLERRSSQWTSGKLFDAFLPMGPAVVTRDEVPDPGGLWIRSWINGDLVQDGSTGDMLYPPAELVAYISALISLQAGDIILTGSPKCLGSSSAPEVYLQPGDRVRLEIEHLGILENPVEADHNG